jgi:hypothetical protein
MDANIAMTHFTIGAVTVAALQWLKSSPWFPWIQAGQTKLLRAISALAAAGTAVGIGYTWNAQDHALTITGLTLTGIALAAWAWLKQFAVQEFMYRATRPSSASAVAIVNPSVTDSPGAVAHATK